MADFNIERVRIQNTVFPEQTGNNAVEAKVSDPIDMGSGKKLPDGPLLVRLQRKNELQAILQQKIQELGNEIQQIKTNYGMVLTDPRCAASRGHVEKMIAEKQNELTEVKAQFAQLEQNLENLSEEEYNKYFQSAFGIEPDEYRMETEQNPDFKIKSPSVDKIKDVTNAIADKNKYGEENLSIVQQHAIKNKTQENEETRVKLTTYDDSQGYITQGCSWFVEHLTCGTSSADVLKALDADEKDIEELQKIAQSGDNVKFNEKYRKITGVDFKVDNIVENEVAQEEYIANQSIERLKDADELLNNEERWNKNPNRISEEVKYSLDYSHEGCMGEWYSGLEKALDCFYDGNEELCKKWIEDKTKALNLENKSQKEKYEALVEHFHNNAKEDIEKTEKALGYSIDYKTTKAAEKKVQETQKAAYGSSMSEEKLKNYTTNVGITRAAVDMGILIASGAAGGLIGGSIAKAVGGTAKAVQTAAEIGSYTAVGLTDFGKSLLESRTDNIESSWRDDLLHATREGVIGAASFGIFAKTSHAVTAAFGKKLGEKAASNIVVKSLSDGAGGAVSGTFDGAVNSVIEGQNPIDGMSEGFTGGGAMGLAMPWLFKGAGSVFKPIGNLASKAIGKLNGKPSLTPKEIAKFRSIIDSTNAEREKARTTSVAKEKAHFDKLYDGVQKESITAKAELKDRLATFKANRKASEKSVEVKPAEITEPKTDVKAEVKPVDIAKPKVETPYAEAAVADAKAVVENAKPIAPVAEVEAPEVKPTESKTEVAKAEPKAISKAEEIANLERKIAEEKAKFIEANKDNLPYYEERYTKILNSLRINYGESFKLISLKAEQMANNPEDYLNWLWKNSPRAKELNLQLILKRMSPEKLDLYNKACNILEKRNLAYDKYDLAKNDELISIISDGRFATFDNVLAHNYAYKVNSPLRRGVEVNDTLRVVLDEGFKEVKPTSDKTTVYRAVCGGTADGSIDFINHIIKAKIGDTFIDKGYSYTTVDRRCATSCNGIKDAGTPNVLLRINIPKGAKVSRGSHTQQQEYLFPRNAEFKIVEPVSKVSEDTTVTRPDGTTYISPGDIEITVEYVVPGKSVEMPIDKTAIAKRKEELKKILPEDCSEDFLTVVANFSEDEYADFIKSIADAKAVVKNAKPAVRIEEVKAPEAKPVEPETETYWDSNSYMDAWRNKIYDSIGAYELTDGDLKVTQSKVPSTTTKKPSEFNLEELSKLNIQNFALTADGQGVRGRCVLNRSQIYLPKLKEAGIEQIIDLREEGKTSACAITCNNSGLEYVKFPIRYEGKMTLEEIKALPMFIKAIQKGKYYIGCNMGTNRTDVAMGLAYLFDPKATVVPEIKSSNITRSIEMLRKACNEILQKNKYTKEYDVSEEYLKEMGWCSKKEFITELEKRLHQIAAINLSK